ncbi:hypothetical protein ACFY40_11470 [Streptomyces sp. NPDC012950]|uniref:hypothetical protein n=1 Tax=Streptomyces sp. NPDC012950 TaxID=3364858 RepID=UPI0036AF3B3A
MTAQPEHWTEFGIPTTPEGRTDALRTAAQQLRTHPGLPSLVADELAWLITDIHLLHVEDDGECARCGASTFPCDEYLRALKVARALDITLPAASA